MALSGELVLGEFVRTIDDRYRLSLPPELTEPLLEGSREGILAKELSGCVSLWSKSTWQPRFDAGLEVILSKMRAGKLDGRWEDVQRLGRLLSTRHRPTQLAGRGRLLLPESYRSFLAVEANAEVMVVGAGVCIEIWNPTAWNRYVESEIPGFRQAFEQLTS
jgi:MraZ protein